MAREDDGLRAVRRERHLRRLGTRHPRCAGCGETAPAALTQHGGEIWCYECIASVAGRPSVEQHHLAGRHNDPTTVPLPGNPHRLLSDEQRMWPAETLRNPTGSPLRTAAAWVRGWLDLLRVICQCAAWIPPFLERLDVWLGDHHGARWWEHPDLADGDDADS